MVSLGSTEFRHFAQGLGGPNQDDDPLLEPNIGTLSAEEEPKFSPINTAWVAVIELLVMVAVETCLFLVTNLEDDKEAVFAFLIFIQVIAWAVTLLIDQYLCRKHRALQRGGYLIFYRQAQKLRRAPLYTFSAGNPLLLVTVVILHKYCNPLCKTSFLASPLYYLQILMSLEVAVSAWFIIHYMVKAVKFNSNRPPPDVHDELNVSINSIHVPQTEIGYKDEDTLDDIVEKQADVIRYLKQHNVHLGNKIMQLTTEINCLKSV